MSIPKPNWGTRRETTEDRVTLHTNNMVSWICHGVSVPRIHSFIIRQSEHWSRQMHCSSCQGIFSRVSFQMALFMWRPSEECTRLVYCLYHCMDQSAGDHCRGSWVNLIESFHHRCTIQTIPGITTGNSGQSISALGRQWRWGDHETAEEQVCKWRLERVGHFARMPNHCIPKMALFGWLLQPHPQGRPKKRWRDTIYRDLQRLHVREDRWYEDTSTSRSVWSAMHSKAVSEESDGVEAHSCIDIDSRMSLDEQHTADNIQWQDVKTQSKGITACNSSSWQRPPGLNLLPLPLLVTFCYRCQEKIKICFSKRKLKFVQTEPCLQQGAMGTVENGKG